MAAPEFIKLPLLAQTAYARLVDLLLTSETGDPALGASLVSKSIRGRRYWYAQRQEDGKKVQSYLGPETAEVLALLERWRRGKVEASTRAELVAMARAGGAHAVGAAEAKILEQLASVFRVGGVLVGSHGFVVLGNMLGVRWQDAIVRTEDVDIAHDHRIAVALARGGPPANVQRALGDPVPRFSALNPNDPATSFRVRGTEVEVEILTPLVGRERSRTISIPTLGTAAIPLRFLDYLIEETQPGAVLGGTGALVNVPRPGRFAFHKLIVAARRGTRAAGITKASKDRAQASALLQVLLAESPGEIALAWKALVRRGRAWTLAVSSSLARMAPSVAADLEQLGIR
ncbi:MAG TPA: GSU2403 family nucleotidyltransferase fold protein [Polyangia bacterium]|nr:GSU2403 family nucleotidyltransferase fold protein [Polyangia bacterium]